MSKSQSKTIHIGNAGEHYIAAQLSRYCIVRDVGQGKDTGIDLYCEILEEDNLSLALHVFCQVKTQRSDINLSDIKDAYWSYWGEQPVPVFLFLVKYFEQTEIEVRNEVWVYDVPYILSKKDAEELGKTLPTRQVDEKFRISAESNNTDEMMWRDFIYHHVRWSYGLWQMRKFGLVLPNPEIGTNQPKQILVGGFSYVYEEKIRR